LVPVPLSAACSPTLRGGVVAAPPAGVLLAVGEPPDLCVNTTTAITMMIAITAPMR